MACDKVDEFILRESIDIFQEELIVISGEI